MAAPPGDRSLTWQRASLPSAGVKSRPGRSTRTRRKRRRSTRGFASVGSPSVIASTRTYARFPELSAHLRGLGSIEGYQIGFSAIIKARNLALTNSGGRAICPILRSRPAKRPPGEYPMQFFGSFRGSRRLVSLSVLCSGLALAGCMGGDDEVAATGSPFSQALFKDYTDLATQAAGAPAPQASDNGGGFFSDLADIFSFSSNPDN